MKEETELVVELRNDGSGLSSNIHASKGGAGVLSPKPYYNNSW